jgi:TRAP-type C4-dicarboxylate transport system permease small subunit
LKASSARERTLAARIAGVLSGVSRLVCYGGAALAFLLPFPILYEVIMDSLRLPPDWVFETSGYAMIMLGFLASGYGLQTGHQFRVTILLERFPRAANLLNRLAGLSEAAFGIVLMVAGWNQAYASYAENIRSDTLLSVPQFWPELALPMGGLVIALQGLAILIHPEAVKLAQHE